MDGGTIFLLVWSMFVAVVVTAIFWTRPLLRLFRPKVQPDAHWKSVSSRYRSLRRRRFGYRYNPAMLIRRLVQRDIEQRGLGPFMLYYGTRVRNYSTIAKLHDQQFGELWEVDVPGDEDIKAVRVHDPFGEQKEYWLRVPPWSYCAEEAVAWTFDMTRYNPIVQT